ncbi:cardioacceleratory peptide receptor-like isoform X2 [Ischnura elegans]|uniref:cardioacceleratory peptide receptor-like isoform X2 n=1 Tax=Ischnura elegans TaxID=197161 RepID=UPI001ED897B2|nr:cardioacceleratory peptide receptor-like isoform X2 [Ischnura elegans]
MTTSTGTFPSAQMGLEARAQGPGGSQGYSRCCRRHRPLFPSPLAFMLFTAARAVVLSRADSTQTSSQTAVLATTEELLPFSAEGGVLGGGNVSVGTGNRTGAGEEGEEDHINSFYFYEAEQFALLWILFAFIVAGNCAVLTALLLAKASRKSRMNFFIMHLAIADLSVGLISVLTDIVWRMTVSWNAGNVACKLIRFLQAMVTYSSTYVLVALSIDRYDAIAHPMNFSGSWRRARILVAAAWLLSAIFSLPILIFYREKSVQGQLQCWIEFQEQWEWQLYMTLVAAALFVAPALLIAACYALILLTIWSKGQRLHVASAIPNSGSRSKPANSVKESANAALRRKFMPIAMNNHSHKRNRDPSQPPRRGIRGVKSGVVRTEEEADCRRASSRGLIPRAKIKTIKMTFVIVFVFVLCWSPYIIFDLLQVYGHVPRTQTNLAVATFIQSLAPLNSAANPIIYCLFSTRLCRGLRRCPLFAWFGRGTEEGDGGCWWCNKRWDGSSALTVSTRQRRNTGGVHSFTTDTLTVSTASSGSTFRGRGSTIGGDNSLSSRYRPTSMHKTIADTNNASSTITSAV